MLALDFDESEELNWLDDDRIHHIDNLRTTITVLLIIQHAITENASYSPYFPSLPLTVFVFLCKTVLPGLFFLVSGYAAAISRENSLSNLGAGRSDSEFLWRRTRRLFLPAVAYATFGHAALWMVLTKGWPLIFGGVGSRSGLGFAKFQGPVVYLFFLYAVDISYVVFRPSKNGAITRTTTLTPPTSPSSERSRHGQQCWPVTVQSTKEWYALVAMMLGSLSLYTVAAAAGSKSEKSFLRFGFGLAMYDTIVPAAPFQFILAYMAGTQLYRWQRYILIQTPFAFPSFAFALFSSISLLLVATMISRPFAEIVRIDTPWSVHPSIIDAGLNFHTVFFAVWNAYAFFTLSATLVSVCAQWEWTRRDWGTVARNSYIPLWFHMMPVVIFTRLFAADNGGRLYPGAPVGAHPSSDAQKGVEWRCVLVATGSIICSWFVGLGFAGLRWLFR